MKKPPLRVVAWIVCVLGISWFVWLHSDHWRRAEHKIDYSIYASCTSQFFSHKTPYELPAFRHACFYPIPIYHAFQWFFRKPSHTKAALWSWLVVATTLLCWLLPLAFFRWNALGEHHKTALLFIGGYGLLDPFYDSISTGNMSSLVASLCYAGCWLVLYGRPRWRWLAGMLLGIGGIIKLFPMYLAGYFLVAGLWRSQRQMRDAGLTALALFGALQWLFWRPDYWAFVMAKDGLMASLVSRGSNNSIMIIFHHFGWHVTPFVMLLLVGLPLGLWILAKPKPLVLESCMVLLVVALTAPAVWSHTYTLFSLPLIVVTLGLGSQPHDTPEARERWKLHALLLVFCLLLLHQGEYFSTRRDWLSLVGIGLMSFGVPLSLGYLLHQTAKLPAFQDQDPDSLWRN